MKAVQKLNSDSLSSLNPTFSLKSPYEMTRRMPEIYSELEARGFAIVKAWDSSETTLLQVASFFGRVQGHPKADEQGIVTVTPEKMENDPSRFERNVSKTSAEFLLHTDGSFLNGICPVGDKHYRLGPPSVFLLQCVRPATSGGESVIVDTEEVLKALLVEQPNLAALAQTRGLLHFFGGDQSALDFPLFEKIHPTTFRVRFRWDLALAQADHAPSLRYLVQNYFLSPRFQKRYRLEANEIIVIDNQRLIHGRDAIVQSDAETARLLRRAWIWNESNPPIASLAGNGAGLSAFESARVYGPRVEKDSRLRPLSLGIRLSRGTQLG